MRAFSPSFRSSLFPRTAGISPSASILSRARSVFSSLPTTVALCSEPSESVTVTSEAFSSFVTISYPHY
ncbi:MAG: hypothetical protein K2J72_02620 [Oscillospiraceae bacterium]|nr:hypothetical protein [Oscillospiraceae bacterium]